MPLSPSSTSLRRMLLPAPQSIVGALVNARPLGLLFAVALGLLVTFAACPAGAEWTPCPAAEHLPQLTIDNIREPTLPVIDDWQVFWGPVPISDVQVTKLAADDMLDDRVHSELDARGSWVYVGMMMVGAGTALSSSGFVLFGRGQLEPSFTLPLALGGMLLNVAGLLLVTHWIQKPLEPLLSPTPEHRLTRDEARDLVARINQRLYREICEAAEAARPPLNLSEVAE